MNRGRWFAIVGGFLLLWSAPAWADSGMAFMELGMYELFMVALLVVVIENLIIKKLLGIKSIMGLVGIANFLSYLAGLPIVYLVSNEGPLYIHVNQYRNPLLSGGLLLGAFVVTLLVETPLLMAGIKEVKEKGRIFKAVLVANGASYLVLFPLFLHLAFFPDYGMRTLFAQPDVVESQGGAVLDGGLPTEQAKE